MPKTHGNHIRKPDWLKIKLPEQQQSAEIRKYLHSNNLHTICESGKCPNFGECWDNGAATFMILGNICTRSCDFCNVKGGKPLPPDPEEPLKIARAVQFMKLKHAVITSVDRDDLPDGGSMMWAETIQAVRKLNPGITVETLIPDFKAKQENLQRIINLKPEIVSHNLETVERLTKKVRRQNIYERSLEVLRILSDAGITTKSGIMVGLGESDKEVFQTMDDLLEVGCCIMTIGQYLQPTPKHLAVSEYIHPDTFYHYKMTGLEKGFRFVESAPKVRSSWHASAHLI